MESQATRHQPQPPAGKAGKGTHTHPLTPTPTPTQSTKMVKVAFLQAYSSSATYSDLT